MKNRLLITSCLFVVSLLFAACGDDSDSATRPAEDLSSSIDSSSASKKTESSSSISVSVVDPSTVVVGNITDSRDGQTYKTVTIGTQTWMAQNLNYETENSCCFLNSPYSCDEVGRLYTWAAAMDGAGTWSSNGKGCGSGLSCTPAYPVRGVCPAGWHLPTKTEFETLFTAVGGLSVAGEMLKSTSGWKSDGNGTDVYSFSALPAGLRNYYGRYDYNGSSAFFWSSTVDDIGYAYYMYLVYYRGNADMIGGSSFYWYSVRCVKDD